MGSIDKLLKLEVQKIKATPTALKINIRETSNVLTMVPVQWWDLQ